MFWYLWVFLQQFSQMRIQFYFSFISSIYTSIKIETKQFKSNESQGDLEKFTRPKNNMMKTFWLDSQTNWNNGVRLLLFAAREAFQEALGFSRFEFVLDTMWEVTKMKQWYDKDTVIREFKSGEKVFVLLLIHCHPLQAK